MKVDIYRSVENGEHYFVVPKGSDTSSLPENVEESARRTIDLAEVDELIGLSGRDALKDIEANGYHMTTIKIVVGELSGGQYLHEK